MPFRRVYTTQQAQAYTPRLRAFEFMLDSLDFNPEDVLHVSSSLRYDLMSACGIGVPCRHRGWSSVRATSFAASRQCSGASTSR